MRKKSAKKIRYHVQNISAKNFLLWGIRFYQRNISGLKGYSSCKYYPTCSCYGLEAIGKYGALKGGAMTVWRILRCNPFSKGGYDPVP